VRAANAAGASLAAVPLRHDDAAGGGPMLMPNTVAIVAGAPHPSQAAALADWLLSSEVARMLAASSSGNTPLQPDVAVAFPDLAIEDPLRVDFETTAVVYPDALDEIAEAWREVATGAR